VLYNLSCQMLAASSMRVAEVAVSLGYADASAFIHAFTRWAGRTPDRWRRAQHRPGTATAEPPAGA
jgi:AraC-like DNA-binding protein